MSFVEELCSMTDSYFEHIILRAQVVQKKEKIEGGTLHQKGN